MAGYGDALMGAGLARGAQARGKRVALGDRRRILWSERDKEIFAGNPNLAPPGSERDQDLEWIEYYKGHRLYNVGHGDHWTWNENFKPKPGEVFFTRDEETFADARSSGLIFIEPNVPWEKKAAPNKDWRLKNYQRVADILIRLGYPVAQFSVGKYRIEGAKTVVTPSFRHSMAVLKKAALVITPEGGLHHAAAAVGVPAIVIFGGFIHPGATGYTDHINLTGGATSFCGRLSPCQHCREALDRITPDEVIDYVEKVLPMRVV